MTVNRDQLAAFLSEIGCPYSAGSTDATIWLNGYLQGVSWTRQQMFDKTDGLEGRVKAMDVAEESLAKPHLHAENEQ